MSEAYRANFLLEGRASSEIRSICSGMREAYLKVIMQMVAQVLNIPARFHIVARHIRPFQRCRGMSDVGMATTSSGANRSNYPSSTVGVEHLFHSFKMIGRMIKRNIIL